MKVISEVESDQEIVSNTKDTQVNNETFGRLNSMDKSGFSIATELLCYFKQTHLINENEKIIFYYFMIYYFQIRIAKIHLLKELIDFSRLV